jgi:hypothetical protein
MSLPTQIESINTAENENDQVFLWRCDALRRAGYSFTDALMLAISLAVPGGGCGG